MTEKSPSFAEALEEFCCANVSQDLRPPEVHLGCVSIDSDGRIVIQAEYDEFWGRNFEPFVVGDQHTLYEWALALADRHPYAPWGDIRGADRASARREVIELFEEARAIYKTVVKAYQARKIQRVCRDWTDVDEPDDTSLVLRAADVLSVVDEVGADGRVIVALRAKRDRQISDQGTIASSDTCTDAAEAVAATPSNSTPRPRASDSAVQTWYEEHLKKHAYRGTPTSEEDDWTAARKEFGDRVRQQQIRKLRRYLAPAAWRKQGRRRVVPAG